MVRDKFNFTWVAAQEGLFRFDGVNSFYYGKNTGNSLHDLPNNSVNAIVISADSNFLWAINNFNGISKINLCTGNIIKYIDFPNQEINSENYFIRGHIVINGTIYFSFENGIVGKIDPLTDSISYSNLHSSIVSFGKINQYLYCISEEYKIMFFDRNFKELHKDLSLVQYKADSRLQTYIAVDENKTLISLNKNLLQLSYDKTSKSFSCNRFQNLPAFPNNISTVQLIDKYLYIGLEDKLVCYDSALHQFVQLLPERQEDEKWLNGVLCIKSFERDLWIGNELGITTAKMKNGAFSAFTHLRNSGQNLNHCYGLCKAGTDDLFVCSTDGLFTINLKTREGRQLDKGYYLYAFKAANDVYVSSNSSGSTFWKKDNDSSPVRVAGRNFASLTSDILVADAAMADSIYFFGSIIKKGLLRFLKDDSTQYFIGSSTKPWSLKNSNINRLFINNKKELMIVCDNVISTLYPKTGRLENKQLIDPASKRQLNIIHDICEINNRYFLAVYGVGIVETDQDLNVINIFNKKNGIYNINLYRIFNIGDSILIASSNNGLFAFNIKTRQAYKYYEYDGLHGNGFEQFSSCRINDSIIAFGGINGFTVVNTNRLALNNKMPVLYFNRISIETDKGRYDSSNLLIKKIEVPSNALQTTIYLSGINYSNPGRVTYSWKLRERSDGWVDIGIQPFISFIGLGPGTYHLMVRVANEDGTYSDPKELILEFLPKWYQTWWFRFTTLTVICLILYALYRYRLNQIKKQHEIRKNIATDLHDDLGSTLTSIGVFTNLAIGGINQKENLQIVKDNLLGATLGLRDMIWVLDDSLDTVADFITRLKQYVLPIAAANKTEPVFIAGNSVLEMTMGKDEKRNLFLICKEAVNNCIKYAGASELKIVFEQQRQNVSITISDNGKGFDALTIKQGYGLKNMQYRADKTRYKIEITSSPGNGTTIKISPL